MFKVYIIVMFLFKSWSFLSMCNDYALNIHYTGVGYENWSSLTPISLKCALSLAESVFQCVRLYLYI